MYADEKIAALEKLMTGNPRPSVREQWSINDIIRAIDTKSILPYRGLELEFETKGYFGDKVELLQIKDLCTKVIKEQSQIDMRSDELHLSKRVKLYQKDTMQFEQWIQGFERTCHDKQWKMLIQKYKNCSRMDYCCCEIITSSRDFCSILFQADDDANDIVIRGVYSCLYSDRKTLGVLLEACILRNFGKIHS